MPLDPSRLAIILGSVVVLVGGCGMRVISKKRLEQFWEARKTDSAIAERDLTAWYKLAKKARWNNFGSLGQTFGSADQVSNCVVFDVGNNRFRLIGRINYARGIIYVLKVMDHGEYDEKLWIDQCGCHQPPPKRPVAVKKGSPTGKPTLSGRDGRT
jgi:mRNA interferase HigB